MDILKQFEGKINGTLETRGKNHPDKRMGTNGQEHCEFVPICRNQQGNNKTVSGSHAGY